MWLVSLIPHNIGAVIRSFADILSNSNEQAYLKSRNPSFPFICLKWNISTSTKIDQVKAGQKLTWSFIPWHIKRRFAHWLNINLFHGLDCGSIFLMRQLWSGFKVMILWRVGGYVVWEGNASPPHRAWVVSAHEHGHILARGPGG